MASTANKCSLLIVDDEADLRDLIAELCRELTDDVTTASDGVEALDLIRKKKFHAILSDINMPRMNGLQLLAEIRALGLDTPFIILSAYGDKKNTVEALRLGAADFIDKPFDDEKLLQTLAVSLDVGIALEDAKKELTVVAEDLKLPAEKRQKLQEARKTLWVIKKEFEVRKKKAGKA